MKTSHIFQPTFFSTPKSQRGAALLTSLLILILLTTLGLASMQTANVEEKMAQNTRFRELAFQAAEAGLREGELVAQKAVKTAGSVEGFKTNHTSFTNDCAAGLCDPSVTEDTIVSSLKTTGKFITGGTTLQSNTTTTPPTFVVQYITSPADPIFVITARGIHGPAGREAEVYLQSTVTVYEN